MELTTAEQRRVEEEERRRVSEKQYRAEVRAKLQGEFVPVQKSRLPWLLGIGRVLVVAAMVGRSLRAVGSFKGCPRCTFLRAGGTFLGAHSGMAPWEIQGRPLRNCFGP
jgi:hypothetical protein